MGRVITIEGSGAEWLHGSKRRLIQQAFPPISRRRRQGDPFSLITYQVRRHFSLTGLRRTADFLLRVRLQ